MSNCAKCGAPLKKGNIKVVRPRGKKRPFRICRRCPEKLPPAPTVEVKPEIFTPRQPDFDGKTHSWKNGTGGNPVQRPQDTTGGPFVVEGVLDVPAPPTFRFFMTRDQAERVKRALDKPIYQGFGVGFEVIPVPDYQVDADPDSFADLVEVTVDWKVE